MACGVNEYITETLDAAGLTVTRTVEQYYADEFGKDSPEYEDHHNDDEFASMSVWTVKGSALIKSIDDGLKRGTLIENKKYEGTFEQALINMLTVNDNCLLYTSPSPRD